MSFIRKKEDFICLNCGFLNKGNGYTNHCFNCLWSLHVDNNPGDRLNECKGLMKPVYVSYTNNSKYLIHKCVKCSFTKKNIVSDSDSIDSLCKIQKELSDNI